MADEDPLEIPDADYLEGETTDAAVTDTIETSEILEFYRIGKLIRTFRKSAGWSQSELSQESDVEEKMITRIESGATPRPQNFTLERLASAFARRFPNLNADELLQDFIDAKNMKSPRSEADTEAKLLSVRLKPFSATYRKRAYDAVNKLLDYLEEFARLGS